MLADDLKKVSEELHAHRERVTALHRMTRFGVLVDAHNCALMIAREIHETARALEGAGNQLELLPDEGPRERGEKGEKP